MIRVTTVAGVCSGIALSSLWLAPTARADQHQYVRTTSGQVRCLIATNDQGRGGGPAVSCEHGPGFSQAPISPSGTHFDIAAVTAAGHFQWDNGNIGGAGTPQNDAVLAYGQPVHILGWTIQPSSDGTRFTNDGSGHGMFVSIDNVSSF